MPGTNREKIAQLLLELLLPALGVSMLAVLYFPRARHLVLELFLWILALLGLGLAGGTVLYVRHMKRLEKQDLPTAAPVRKTLPNCPICGVGLPGNAADPTPDRGFIFQGHPSPATPSGCAQDQSEPSDTTGRPV